MIKTILSLLAKVLENKLVKNGLEQEILKNQNYIQAAKVVWHIVDEHFRISETVEEKLASKADMFDKMLLAKFPELSQSDVAELRQAIAGEVNQGKAAVIDNSTLLQQLQAENTDLKQQILNLNTQLQNIEAALKINTVQA